MWNMLTLTEHLPDYMVLYNGSKSGAVVSSHFHMQAGLTVPLLLREREREVVYLPGCDRYGWLHHQRIGKRL